jgi:hypothetical protein
MALVPSLLQHRAGGACHTTTHISPSKYRFGREDEQKTMMLLVTSIWKMGGMDVDVDGRIYTVAWMDGDLYSSHAHSDFDSDFDFLTGNRRETTQHMLISRMSCFVLLCDASDMGVVRQIFVSVELVKELM